MSDSRDELDRLLDSALVTYADPGSESKLAEHVLDRIAAESTPGPRRRWLVWALALPAAACLVLAVVFLWPGTSHLQLGEQEQAHSTEQPAVPAGHSAASPAVRSAPVERAGVSVSKQRSKRRVVAGGPAPLPKLDMFPMPRPLSPEEQALIDFAARATKSERRSLLEAQGGLNAPLHFAEVPMKPLELPALGTTN